jgi:hypothetical protein
MKIFILVLDIVCIVLTSIFSIIVVTYLKKSEDIDIETIRQHLDKKIKLLQILTIILTILNVILIIDSNFKIL